MSPVPIESLAERAGEVLTSEESVSQVGDGEVRSERAATVELKGVVAPVTLYRVLP